MALPDSNYKNLAAAVIPNPGATTDTSITISATDGATFPNAPFFATIMPIDRVANSTNSEIVEVTAVNTSGTNTTFTVTRAQRSTSAISWNANGAVITHAVYTEDVTPLQDAAFIGQELSTPTDVAYVATENIQDGAVTSQKIDYTTIENVNSTRRRVGNWTDQSGDKHALYEAIYQLGGYTATLNNYRTYNVNLSGYIIISCTVLLYRSDSPTVINVNDGVDAVFTNSGDDLRLVNKVSDQTDATVYCKMILADKQVISS